MTDIMTFDPQALQQRVAESIRTQFGMLIPDQAFNDLVSAAITDFFEKAETFKFEKVTRPNPHGYSYNNDFDYCLSNALTPFQAMVWTYLQDMVRARLKDWINEQQQTIKQQIDAIFKDDQVLTVALNLNISQLSERLARNAHAHIIEQAAQQVGYNLSGLQMKIDQIAARTGTVY